MINITVKPILHSYHSVKLINEHFVKSQKRCFIKKIVLYDENVSTGINNKGGLKEMPKVEVNQVKKLKSKVEDRSSLKGTLASVFLLGFFLIVTWVGVYFLFLDRL